MEKSIHYATQPFWRTMTATSLEEAQTQLDRFCERITDKRPRPVAKLEAIVGMGQAAALLAERNRNRPTVGDLASLEPLGTLPASPYPVTIEVTRRAGPSALVAFEGNRYSLPPGLVGVEVKVRHRLGSARIEIVSASGACLARHCRETPGLGRIVRDSDHHAALEHRVLSAFTTLTEDEQARLTTLATLGARCRSSVVREGYSREIELVPGHERSPRLFSQLRQLHAGLTVLGTSTNQMWELLAKVALDGMHPGRRSVLGFLMDHPGVHATAAIAGQCRLTITPTRRHLQDLCAHGVLELAGDYPERWVPSEWLREVWWAVGGGLPLVEP